MKERSSSVGTRCIASEVEGGEAHSHSVTGRLLVMVPRKRMGGDACVAEGEGLNVNWTRATIKDFVGE